MAGDVTKYTDLITSEHADKEKFAETVAVFCQPFADISAVLASMAGLFDLDVAVGDQLDVIGLWVGVGRLLEVPLENVYFSFDTAGLGFDEGTWQGPFDPTTGLESLPDDSYRTLIRAKIAQNHWDGSIPSAYAFLAPVFPDHTILIQDNQNMSMLIGIVGSAPLDAVSYALLTGGYLSVKPAGVRIAGYATPSVEGGSLFGFDVNNSSIGGFDSGTWATIDEG